MMFSFQGRPFFYKSKTRSEEACSYLLGQKEIPDKSVVKAIVQYLSLFSHDYLLFNIIWFFPLQIQLMSTTGCNTCTSNQPSEEVGTENLSQLCVVWMVLLCSWDN